TVTPSRFDLHIDWQGVFAPTFDVGESERFIKLRRGEWDPHFEGGSCTGDRLGAGGASPARPSNKRGRTREKHDEGYAALLAARSGALFDPDRDVWRLEFQIRREGITAFQLAPPADSGPSEGSDDLEAEVQAELSAEELPHIGTFPKLFAHR